MSHPSHPFAALAQFVWGLCYVPIQPSWHGRTSVTATMLVTGLMTKGANGAWQKPTAETVLLEEKHQENAAV